jgi:uncharacterized protein YdeI (YjbR/CyaY-like superfamily)
MRIASPDDVARLAEVVPAYVRRAVAAEDAGLVAGPAPGPELPPELRARLDADPALAAAFAALTPGRQREYALHVAGAKQAATREARIDRLTAQILAGKGLRER